MSKIQILVTTMHQKDFNKYNEMNLQTDAIIANQSDKEITESKKINGNIVFLITSQTRGLSKNRNIAINHIFNSAEYIMFSDDDLYFKDAYESLIINEFDNHPEADAIKFNLNCISERKLNMKYTETFHKVSRREVTSWGVWGLVIKASVIKEKKLQFNERFGTGTKNYCGEDTIFLQELLKKKVKLYASPVCIADIDQSISSWFEGFNERRFITSGMVISEIYPRLAYLLVIRSAYKFSKRQVSKLGFWKILNCYYKGIKKNKAEKSSK